MFIACALVCTALAFIFAALTFIAAGAAIFATLAAIFAKFALVCTALTFIFAKFAFFAAGATIVTIDNDFFYVYFPDHGIIFIIVMCGHAECSSDDGDSGEKGFCILLNVHRINIKVCVSVRSNLIH